MAHVTFRTIWGSMVNLFKETGSKDQSCDRAYPADRGTGRGTSSLDYSTTSEFPTPDRRHCRSPTLSQTMTQTEWQQPACRKATASTNKQ